MPQFFLNKRLILLLVSIIILVALIGFSIRDREELTWPEQFLKDTTGWAQSLVSRPANYIADFVKDLQDLQNTYRENEELKKRLDEYARLQSQVQILDKENKELRDILDKKDNLRNFEPTQATVVARNPDQWQWNEKVIINKGKVNGIEKDMAVITSRGLIGKIKNTSQFTSTVQLLSATDPKNRISAVVQGDIEVFGLIEGFDKEEELLLLKRIPFDAVVEKDQLVTTSGLGGVFPKGLVIGKVIEVKPDQFGLTQTAYIEPAADFYDIEHVMVVKRNTVKVDLEELEDEG